MRKWDESKALSVLIDDDFEIIGKLIKKVEIKNGKKTATGLKKLSAIDFLVNHCGYKF